jgi:hypothetical protein
MRIALGGIAALAIVVWLLQAIAWPVSAGRNLNFYVLYYFEMWHRHPVLPALMLTIKPLPALVFGPLLQATGATGTAIACAVMYAGAVTAYTWIAATLFGRVTGAVTTIVLLAYPPFGALFHEPSGDALFALAFALWCVSLVRALARPSYRAFALQAIAIFLLVMTRSANQMLAVVALSPLLLTALAWRRRVAYTATFAAAVLVGLLAVNAFDAARYGQFTASRTASANFPLYRLFAFDHLVEPSNGPATRELARAVQQDLLTRQPYKAYHVTVSQFFADASPRFWSDLVPLSDRYWGWNSNYRKLRAVSIEAIRAHPRAYAHDVFTTVREQFSDPVFTGAPLGRSPAPAHPAAAPTIRIDGRSLPQPSEGQPIPAANLDWTLSTPDQSVYTDWSSIASPVVRFRDPADARQFHRDSERERELLLKLGQSSGSASAARVLNRVERLFPPLWLWLLVGALGFALRRRAGTAAMVTLVGIAVAVVVGSAIGQPFTPPYRVPFDPVFLLFGVAGVLAPGAWRLRSNRRAD